MTDLFTPDAVAVITGAASGIGRAAALHGASRGMRLVLIDANGEKLARTRDGIAAIVGPDKVRAETLDVADAGAMAMLASDIAARWEAPTLLMNNAAAFVSGGPGGILDPLENWRRVFNVNVFGVINGVAAFLPFMLASGKRGAIINTGSKQGLTNPPGNPAYNTSKAAVNAYTQNLAHDLRNREGAKISAHLLVPGWTTTGEAEHRQGAWLPEQVIAYMVEALGRDAFYIICPDDETTSEMDRKRVLWNALDIVHGRPALSRWHKDFKDAFARFMTKDLPKDE
jgi:NAD(P)-dependent dehydrogenase (short-subunit alcohol dehydrogenase family)